MASLQIPEEYFSVYDSPIPPSISFSIADVRSGNYRASKYIDWLDFPWGTDKLVYSTYAYGAALLSDEMFRKVGSHVPMETDREIGEMKSLFDQRIIVPGDFDEDYEFQQLIAAGKSNILYLNIGNTLKCNVHCPHCYVGDLQGDRRLTMQAATLSALKEWIRRRIETHPYTSVQAHFLGGEPMLALAVMTEIGEYLSNLAAKGNFDLYMRVISNGSNLTPRTISALQSVGFNSVQFTFEGSPEMHNLRRGVRKNAAGSYEDLIAKIPVVSRALEATLRVNVDWQNVATMPVLFAELLSLGRTGVFDVDDLDVSLVKDYFDTGAGHMAKFVGRDYSRTLLLLRLTLLYKMSAGLGINVNDIVPVCPCRFNIFDGYSIDPFGDIYICSTLFGNPIHAHGNVSNPQLPIPWDGKAGLPVECLSKGCRYLPTCLGGCPLKSDLKYGDLGKIVCPLDEISGHLRTVLPLLALDRLSNSAEKQHILKGELASCIQSQTADM